MAEIPADRKNKLLSKISIQTQKGLEIGPLSTPIVKKNDGGGGIFYIDHAPAEVLKEKYKDASYVNPDDIVKVDYIWGEKTLPELVDKQKFDYVIASHVIEHVPDMVGWLKEIATVLEDGGILSLAIPDKRYTFDFKREVSSPGKVIEDYLLHKRHPSLQSVFDYMALTGEVDLERAWKGEISKSQITPTSSLNFAYEVTMSMLNSSEYFDVHVNVCTPTSFLEILEVLIVLNLFDYKIVDFFDTKFNTFEFFISLERCSRSQSQLEIVQEQVNSFGWVRTKVREFTQN